MKFSIKNSRVAFNLTNKDWIAGGGEGNIYIRNNLVYKIFFNGKMVPEGKIKELSLLKLDCFVKPIDMIVDESNQLVGHTMEYLNNSDYISLSTLFTNTYKLRENVSDEKIFNLIKLFQENIKHVHLNKILIVDLNEFNFLVSKDLTNIKFLDITSYQTPNYPATAIMDSIRDWTANRFSELTDWYSFAILSFQLLTGLHPFRSGNHSSYAHGTLDDRSKARSLANVSVLNPQTKFPKAAARPFTVIPPAYLRWYTDIFERGKRLAPPDKLVADVIQVAQQYAINSAGLKVDIIFNAPQTIKRFQFVGNHSVIETDKFLIIDGTHINKKLPCDNPFKINGSLYFTGLDRNGLTIYTALRQEAVATYQADIKGLFFCEAANCLVGQIGDRLFKLEIRQAGSKLMILPSEVAQTMENATFIGDGVAIQNMMGTNFVHYLTTGGSNQIRLHELDKQKVLQASLHGNILAVISKDSGKKLNYYLWELNKRLITKETDITNRNLQATRLDNGLYLETQEDGSLKISSGSKAKLIKDTFLEDSYLLATRSDDVFVAKGNTVFQIKVK